MTYIFVRFYLLIILLTFSQLSRGSTGQFEVSSLLVNPSTLEFKVKDKGEILDLSLAQEEQKVSDVKQSNGKLAFTRNAIKFEVHVEDSRLRIDLQNTLSNENVLTFPVVRTQSELVLPMLEGIVVSRENRDWLSYQGNREVDLMEALSFPAWGAKQGGTVVSFARDSGLEASVRFSGDKNALNMVVSNRWPRNDLKRVVSFVVDWKNQSLLAPADLFRSLYGVNSSSLNEKVKANSQTKKLLGAFHIYIWGGKILESVNVISWPRFLARLSSAKGNDYVARVAATLPQKTHKMLSIISKEKRKPYIYEKREIVEAVSEGIAATPSVVGAKNQGSLPNLLNESKEIQKKREVFASSFPSSTLEEPKDWGDGVSPWIIRKLKESGINAAWLGLEAFQDGLNHIEFIQEAKRNGFLVGAYDSYHSMHDPENIGWQTADLGEKAYKEARIVKSDGKESKGFLGKGFHVNSKYIRPIFENRTSSQLSLGFNSWFIDCDGAGELFSHYGKHHPMRQIDDLNERIDRLKWLESKHGVVVGTEGARSYSVAGANFAHGTLTPPFTYSFKPIFQDKKSKYHIGGWYPGEDPQVMFKNVQIPEEQKRLFYDPKVQIPLFERAFHDQIVATHHWEIGTLKFSNAQEENILREILYGVPPLLHLNRREWQKHGKVIARYFEAVSQYLPNIATEELRDFSYLTANKLVQKTTFLGGFEVVANFSDQASYRYNGKRDIPRRSALVKIGNTERLIDVPFILTGKHAKDPLTEKLQGIPVVQQPLSP